MLIGALFNTPHVCMNFLTLYAAASSQRETLASEKETFAESCIMRASQSLFWGI